MKFKRLLGIIILSMLSAKIYAEDSQARTIEKIMVEATSATPYYYFVNQAEGWGAPSCPNAFGAYLAESAPGAKSILSLAMAAKATGTKMRFKGTCSDNNYFLVNYAIAE